MINAHAHAPMSEGLPGLDVGYAYGHNPVTNISFSYLFADNGAGRKWEVYWQRPDGSHPEEMTADAERRLMRLIMGGSEEG